MKSTTPHISIGMSRSPSMCPCESGQAVRGLPYDCLIDFDAAEPFPGAETRNAQLPHGSSLAAWPRSTQKAPPYHAANAEPPSVYTLRGALNGFLADRSVSMRGRAGFSLVLAQQLAQAIERLFPCHASLPRLRYQSFCEIMDRTADQL
jgi:hypothetical protein